MKEKSTLSTTLKIIGAIAIVAALVAAGIIIYKKIMAKKKADEEAAAMQKHPGHNADDIECECDCDDICEEFSTECPAE